MENKLTERHINQARTIYEGIEKGRALEPASLSSDYHNQDALQQWIDKTVEYFCSACSDPTTRGKLETWIKKSNKPNSIIPKLISLASTFTPIPYELFPIYQNAELTISGLFDPLQQSIDDFKLQEEIDRVEIDKEDPEAVMADYAVAPAAASVATDPNAVTLTEPVFDPAKHVLSELQKSQPENGKLDDIGISELFIKLYGHVVRYCPDEGVWFAYDGKVWKHQKKPVIAMKYLKDFQRKLCVYGSLHIEDYDKQQAFLKAITKYGAQKCLVNLLACAESWEPVSISSFDQDGDLFNCQNGTYNLRTGIFKPHDYNDHLTQISNVVYDPSASSDLWDRTIYKIMDGNQVLIDYLHRMLGYTLTTDTSLKNFFICWGLSTNNGKSTTFETMTHLMGDYAETLDPASLSYDNSAKKKGSTPAPDIYKLRKCRFVAVREPERKVTLASALLKTMTGRDTISARTLYMGEELKFVASCKVWFNTNWKFSINDITLFTSNRVRIIPFNHHFEDKEQDKYLIDKLKQPENISGLFNRLLEGLKQFRSLSESEPEEIKDLIREYEKEEDTITRFVSERMEKQEDETTHRLLNSAPAPVYDEYYKWCSSENLSAVGKRRFLEELRARRLMAPGRANGMSYKEVITGLVLKSS